MGSLCDMKMRFLCEAKKTTANGAYSRHQIVVPTRSQSRIPFFESLSSALQNALLRVFQHVWVPEIQSHFGIEVASKNPKSKKQHAPGRARNIWQHRLRDQTITIKLVLVPQHELILPLVKNELSCDAIENSCCEWLYLIPIPCEYPLWF